MEDQFSDSSFEETNRLIHSAFNSPYAMHHAKNVAIRKQLLESAIQKLLESKTFYISDVRDIAAMNNRVFDSRSKLYEQLNILNCREYRKMRAAVLELLPLMIHRATGIPEQRFFPIVEGNRPAAERGVEQAAPAAASAQANAASGGAGNSVAASAPSAAAEAIAAARQASTAVAAAPAPAQPSAASVPSILSRPVPLVLSLGLNLVLGAALLVSVLPAQSSTAAHGQAAASLPAGNAAGAGDPSRIAPVSFGPAATAGTAKATVVDSIIRTASPAASLSQVAAALPADKTAGQQYIIGVRIEKVVN